MLRVRHPLLIAISGLIWLGIGIMLLSMGTNFLIASALDANQTLYHPFLQFLAKFTGSLEQSMMVILALGLGVGLLKGRLIFSKTVNRSVKRILSLPNPTSILNIYEKKYYFLLLGMVLLGFLARLTPQDIRGFIDVAVGAALIQGAILYFRQAISQFLLKASDTPQE